MLVKNLHLHTNWPPTATFRHSLIFLAELSVTEWKAKDCGTGISKAAIHLCCMPSVIDQMKESQERGTFVIKYFAVNHMLCCPFRRYLCAQGSKTQRSWLSKSRIGNPCIYLSKMVTFLHFFASVGLNFW